MISYILYLTFYQQCSSTCCWAIGHNLITCHFSLPGAHPLPFASSQQAQPELNHCVHLLHQVSSLSSYTPKVWQGALKAWRGLVV